MKTFKKLLMKIIVFLMIIILVGIVRVQPLQEEDMDVVLTNDEEEFYIDEGLKEEFYYLPEDIQKQLIVNNWRILYTYDLKMDGESWAGITDYDEKIIYIDKEYSEKGLTLYHEVAHVLDYYNHYSDKEDFKEMKKKTVNYYRKNYFKVMYDDYKYFCNDDSEYFAELFALYMMNMVQNKNVQNYYCMFVK